MKAIDTNRNALIGQSSDYVLRLRSRCPQLFLSSASAWDAKYFQSLCSAREYKFAAFFIYSMTKKKENKPLLFLTYQRQESISATPWIKGLYFAHHVKSSFQ